MRLMHLQHRSYEIIGLSLNFFVILGLYLIISFIAFDCAYSAPSTLKSRKSFLRTVPPLDKHTTHQLKTQNLWQNYTDNIPNQHKLQSFPVQESLPPGYKLQCNKLRCLNRLRSGVGKTKSLLLKWGYLLLGTDTTCQCGKENQTMNHLLTCEKTGTTCTMDDLLQCNSNAKKIATAWCNLI